MQGIFKQSLICSTDLADQDEPRIKKSSQPREAFQECITSFDIRKALTMLIAKDSF